MSSFKSPALWLLHENLQIYFALMKFHYFFVPCLRIFIFTLHCSGYNQNEFNKHTKAVLYVYVILFSHLIFLHIFLPSFPLSTFFYPSSFTNKFSFFFNLTFFIFYSERKGSQSIYFIIGVVLLWEVCC